MRYPFERTMTGADKPITPPLEHLPAEDAPPPALKGIEALRDAWKRLPTKPGVYRMIGGDGEVLYVGTRPYRWK
jgi:excinuclease ABC subunit C